MKNYNHPETCWVHIPSDNSVGVVKWCEHGYYETDYPHNYTKEIVAEMNTGYGYTPTEIEAMQICSIANIPETEDAWEKHFGMVCRMIDKRKG